MRGGFRANAGRKPLLSDIDRLEVGIQCETEFLSAAKAKEEAAFESVFAQSDYAAVIAKINTIPVHLRLKWLESEECEQHLADVELERHAVAVTDPDGGESASRIVSIPPQKPTGVRKRIVTAVAEDWSNRIGRRITPSTVTRCWEEARSFIKRISEHNGNEPKV